MSIELFLYVINVIASIDFIASSALVFWCVFVIISTINRLTSDSVEEIYFPSVKSSIPYIVIVLIFGAIIPSERTMYLILGAHYLKNSALPSKVESVIERKIDAYLSEDIKMPKAVVVKVEGK